MKHLSSKEIIFNEKQLKEYSIAKLEEKYKVLLESEIDHNSFDLIVKTDILTIINLHKKNLLIYEELYNKLIAVVAYDLMFDNKIKNNDNKN